VVHIRTRAVALAGVLGLLAGCGTSLPDRDFNVLGSGKPVVQVSGAAGTQGGSEVGGTGTGKTSTRAGGQAPGSTVVGGNQPGTTSGSGGGGVPSGGSGHGGKTKGSGGGSAKTPTGPSTVNCGSGDSASDTGVTAKTIKIGTIYSGTGNPFAPDQFIPNFYGLESYVSHIDALGGVCGRQIQLVHCDDNGDRNQDIACARTLIDQDKVFALVANNAYQYAGASFVSQSKVPDIGGEPITGNAYYTFPGLYPIEGSYYPNNGTPPSQYFGPYGLGLWFKQHLHLSRVGVIYYAQADSERGANFVKGWLNKVGVKVDTESVPLAGDPTPEVQDMKANHDQAVFDSLDINGDQKVCAAMQQYGFNVPKISTISIWTQQAGQALGNYPCLKNYYSWGWSTNYADSSSQQAAVFRKAYATYAPGAPLAQWSLEGWAAGMWFADAAASCGAHLTRTCVEHFVNTGSGYSARGLMDPNTTKFPHYSHAPSRLTQCDTIVKWAGGSGGTWQTVVDHAHNCHTTGVFSYPAS
jgi:branched-chain amino acid transport system substrate-binding protein